MAICSRKHAAAVFKLVLVCLLVIALVIIILPESRFSKAVRRGFESFWPDSLRTAKVEKGCGIVLFFSPCSESDPDGIDDKLIEFIDSARAEIKGAIYSLDLDNVANALINAKSRGVKVSIVYDASNPTTDISRVVKAGIDVVFRPPGGGLMHNKFVVVDGERTWTGSLNFTPNGAYREDNNALIIKSNKIAEDYISEFDEMFQKRFGAGSPRNTPNPHVFLDGVEVEVYFAPEDNVEGEILSELEQAKKEILFMAFSFTSDPIAREMADRMKDGVKVRGIFEKAQRSKYTEYDFLKNAGANVRWDTNRYNMHNKVIIIDHEVVITGSYNFSKRANTMNDENCIIIHSSDTAEEFLREFERLFN